MTTPEGVVKRILETSLAHPAWGCIRLSNHLKLAGISVSSPTIGAAPGAARNILIKHGMGTRYDRWLKLEAKEAEQAIKLTGEQVAFIEKQNSAFRERHVESSRPGELLCQDTFYVGRLKGVGKVWLHAAVDTFGSYAFGFLHTTKKPEPAAALLHKNVLPFYRGRDIPVGGRSSRTTAESSAGRRTIPISSTLRSTTSNIARPGCRALAPPAS